MPATISRDILGAPESHVALAPSAPRARRAIVWVTTQHFLEMFGFGHLRDLQNLPDLDALDAEGGLGREVDDGVEAALGLIEEEGAEDSARDETEVEA